MKQIENQIESLKELEKNILQHFVDACGKLNLKYYVLEGTLLGTVRHKGFIPWDDDIDVGMPREDYERFMTEGQKYLPEHYFVQNIFSEKDYRANYAKIRDSRTTFIETSVRHCKINHGVYIDIFPLDYCYDNFKKQKRFFWGQLLMRARIGMGFFLPHEKKTFAYRVVRWGARILSVIRYPTIRSALIAREKWMQKLPPSNTYANYCSAWYKKEIIPKDWFGEGEYLEFEGIRVRVPKEYDKWLTRVYGDYMQLPPEEKRVAHHYADVIDPNKPYTFYTKNIQGEEMKL